MSTPGRRKALKRLAGRKRANKRRIRRGQKPILNDPRTGKPKRVSTSTFRKRTGVKIKNIKKKK